MRFVRYALLLAAAITVAACPSSVLAQDSTNVAASAVVRLAPSTIPGSTVVLCATSLRQENRQPLVFGCTTFDEMAQAHLEAFYGAVHSDDVVLHNGQMYDWFNRLVLAGVVDPNLEGMKAFLQFNREASGHAQWAEIAPYLGLK